MHRFLSVVASLCVALSVSLTSHADTYDYPFDDPYVATVVGTPEAYRADLPEKIPTKLDEITIFPDRDIPDFLWYDGDLRYSYAFQKGPAPLVFLIAGTGGSHNGGKNQIMAKAFHQAGFHYIALSSPTFQNFVVAASETSVPGHAFRDAEDLYRVMERIWDKFRDKVEVTNFYVTGYSLGGFNTAFVTKLDEERQVFNFKKALLINPPVRLYSSISLLDRMLENIPGGVDNFDKFYNDLVDSFSEIYKRSDSVNLNEDFLYKVYEALKPKDEELAALIGTSFRISAGNMAFTSDVMTNYGYVKPRNVILTPNSNVDEYERVVYHLGFTDFFHAFFFPYYRADNPVSRSKMINEMSLSAIKDYLHGAEKIEVMHNEDDVILEPGQIDFFRRVFGDRAKIYPKGGHCGNMDYTDNVAYMVNVFKQGESGSDNE